MEFIFISPEEAINYFQFKNFVPKENQEYYYPFDEEIVKEEEILFYNHFKYMIEPEEDEERKWKRLLMMEYGKGG